MFKVPALLVLLPVCRGRRPPKVRSSSGSGARRRQTVAEAKVATVNNGTNFRYESTTNGASEYTLANNLPPGTYRIEVEKSGFKKLVRPDVTLHVQDALAIARPSSSCFSGRSEFRTVGGPQPFHVKR